MSGDACSPINRPVDLTGYSGTFSSSEYPGNYFDDSDCQWRIQASVSSDVSISKSHFPPLNRVCAHICECEFIIGTLTQSKSLRVTLSW